MAIASLPLAKAMDGRVSASLRIENEPTNDSFELCHQHGLQVLFLPGATILKRYVMLHRPDSFQGVIYAGNGADSRNSHQSQCSL